MIMDSLIPIQVCPLKEDEICKMQGRLTLIG